jgi:hypothetical protein
MQGHILRVPHPTLTRKKMRLNLAASALSQ